MNNELLAILQLMLVPGLGVKTLAGILRTALQEGEAIEHLVCQSADDLISRYGLRPGIAEIVGDTQDQAMELVERLDGHGIAINRVTPMDLPPSFDELPPDFPPVLFSFGDISLLYKPSVAFSGSRRAMPAMLESVASLAGKLATGGSVILSGMAPGVDLTAHAATLESGGTTIAVLASGIFNFSNSQEIAPFAESGDLLILSEFLPRSNWTTYQAMRRNFTICDLADVIVLAGPGLTGGTFAMGQIALDRKRPVFILDPEDNDARGDGFDHFVRLGVKPVTVSDISELQSLIDVAATDRSQNR